MTNSDNAFPDPIDPSASQHAASLGSKMLLPAASSLQSAPLAQEQGLQDDPVAIFQLAIQLMASGQPEQAAQIFEGLSITARQYDALEEAEFFDAFRNLSAGIDAASKLNVQQAVTLFKAGEDKLSRLDLRNTNLRAAADSVKPDTLLLIAMNSLQLNQVDDFIEMINQAADAAAYVAETYHKDDPIAFDYFMGYSHFIRCLRDFLLTQRDFAVYNFARIADMAAPQSEALKVKNHLDKYSEKTLADAGAAPFLYAKIDSTRKLAAAFSLIVQSYQDAATYLLAVFKLERPQSPRQEIEKRLQHAQGLVTQVQDPSVRPFANMVFTVYSQLGNAIESVRELNAPLQTKIDKWWRWLAIYGLFAVLLALCASLQVPVTAPLAIVFLIVTLFAVLGTNAPHYIKESLAGWSFLK